MFTITKTATVFALAFSATAYAGDLPPVLQCHVTSDSHAAFTIVAGTKLISSADFSDRIASWFKPAYESFQVGIQTQGGRRIYLRATGSHPLFSAVWSGAISEQMQARSQPIECRTPPSTAIRG